MKIDKSKPAMVTGATGYVAGWLVKKLLDEGISVHAAVRDPKNDKKLSHLKDLAEGSEAEIKFFKSDLLEEGSYDEAMKGCDVVFHTASPFALDVKDNKRDLLDPALKGTRNVLNSVDNTESVKRVVLTSSCASIYGDNIDLQKTKNGVFTEEDWNTSSSLNHQPYSYSKVMAEREAWKMVQDQKRWDLVVVNPSFVIGPGINPNATSGSFTLLKQMTDGTMKFGAPEFNIGVVDVRDVADAHFMAAFKPEASGRHIISAENSSLLELAAYLRDEFGDKYPFPKNKLPKFLVWILAPASGMTRKEVARSIGHPWKADNSKSKTELGIQYRPLKKAIVEMFQQMLDYNMLQK